jgi:hypothetical protein
MPDLCRQDARDGDPHWPERGEEDPRAPRHADRAVADRKSLGGRPVSREPRARWRPARASLGALPLGPLPSALTDGKRRPHAHLRPARTPSPRRRGPLPSHLRRAQSDPTRRPRPRRSPDRSAKTPDHGREPGQAAPRASVERRCGTRGRSRRGRRSAVRLRLRYTSTGGRLRRHQAAPRRARREHPVVAHKRNLRVWNKGCCLDTMVGFLVRAMLWGGTGLSQVQLVLRG